MKTKNLLWGLLLLLVASCTRKADIPGGDLFQQQVMLLKVDGSSKKQAAFSDLTSVTATAEDTDTWREVKFSATLVKENMQDVTVNIGIDTAAAQQYNRVYGTSYKLLPDDLVTFTGALHILPGNVSSEEGVIKMKVSAALADNTPYIVAFTTKTASAGVDIMNASKTLLYTIEKTKGVIKKSVLLTRSLYMQIEGTPSIGNIGASFTMEGLVYVDKFRGPGDGGDAGISTFMGTEGKTLMRFGDQGVDPDHLQANGQDIGVKFKTKTWYHIALVVEGNKTTAYVNGKKVTDFAKSGSLSDFLIGRSYGGNRGMPGRVSEIRLWKTARTAAEIMDNMYTVDKKSTGLYAYWKMNEVKDNKIEDASGNGKNLVMMGQADLTGRQNILLQDEEGIKVGQY